MLTDLPDALANLSIAGGSGRMAWPADADNGELLLVEADADNLGRLDRWMQSRPKRLVPGLA